MTNASAEKYTIVDTPGLGRRRKAHGQPREQERECSELVDALKAIADRQEAQAAA